MIKNIVESNEVSKYYKGNLLDCGYEKMEDKLSRVGADIIRIKGDA